MPEVEQPRIGVDLGGTKIEAALLDVRGAICARRRIPTPQGDYVGTLHAMVSLIHALERDAGVSARVGVATPGALSPHTGRIQNANSTVLNGQPLDRDLSTLLGRPVRFANDADCFALSEALDGAAAGAGTVFGVILGTGVGGGIVVNGQLLNGPNAIAGEWGHNPLPWPTDEERPGPPCYCGRFGCVETFLSGPGLLADAHASTAWSFPDVPALMAAAEQGDGPAAAAVQRHAERLARALAAVINILDPEVIVLGGGLSNLRHLYIDVPAQWTRWVFSPAVRTRLVPPKYGDSSGVRGAAWLWPAREPPS